MICPHCGKDTEAVYLNGRPMTREAAIHRHQRLLGRLEVLAELGAYKQDARNASLEAQDDAARKECQELEVALYLW